MQTRTRRHEITQSDESNVENEFTKVKHGIKRKSAVEKSWFEERREENLKANAAFLASLNINQVKSELKPKRDLKKESSSRGIKVKQVIEPREYHLRPIRTPVTRSTAAEVSLVDELMLPSASLFSSQKNQQSSELSRRGLDETTSKSARNHAQRTEAIIAFIDCLLNKDSSCSAVLDIIESGSNPSPKPAEALTDLVQMCSKMKIDTSLVAKVTPQRIYSIDLHPTTYNSPLVAAGDKWGHVGLWNVIPDKSAPDDGVCLFKPHVAPVNCTQFSVYDPHSLYTSSYDGTVRKCDIVKQQFMMVYNTPDEDDIQHMYLNEVDTNTVCVVSTDSYVTYIDSRAERPRISKYFDTQSGKLKCVSHHPIEKQYFITSSVKGYVDLWDNRYLSKACSPLTRLPQNKGTLSAFFSPLTGNKIVSCSAGDLIRVYDSTALTDITTSASFYHNNWTGRWLSNFRATWHPSREDCFLIGSMKSPRQIELYACDGQLLHTFHDDGNILQSVTSLNTFHPTQPVLAGANSSGRVFVFIHPDNL